jgi:hypothetical protein
MTRRTRHGADSRCGACGMSILRQFVDVLTVTVNATPIEPGTDAQHRDPHHLTWCVPPQATGPPRLRWIYGWHPPNCPHPHHAEHRCTQPHPPAAPQQPAAQPGLF